jgi:hypothetical protein
MSTDPTPPPHPPGPGLRWVLAHEVLADQLIEWLDGIIAEHHGAERQAMLRARPRAIKQLRAMAKMHFAQVADQ